MDEITKDKIRGLVFGQALGDAIGVPYEFKFKRDGHKYEFPYKDQIRLWSANDWTDDTDQMVLIMETLTACKLHNNEDNQHICEFAKKLKFWKENGFPELGDNIGEGCGGSTQCVINRREFEDDPHSCAKGFWSDSGKSVAPNGAVMRTSIIGALGLISGKLMLKHAEDFCKVTHWDPRCVYSCFIICEIIDWLIRNPNKSIPLKAFNELNEGIPTPTRTKTRGVPQAWYQNKFETYSQELDWYFNANLIDMELDKIPGIGYTLKCLGCGIWTARIINGVIEKGGKVNFAPVIYSIVRECGDADTNGAVAGAVLGAHLGFSQLPRDWIEAMPNWKWLMDKTDKFIETLSQ